MSRNLFLFSGDCTFQHSTCDWEIIPPENIDNQFQFYRTNTNESVIVGPPYDHFGDRLGYYVIAFGELESKEGDVAVMISPIFENIPEQCFHFHFTYNVIFSDYLQFGVVYK